MATGILKPGEEVVVELAEPVPPGHQPIVVSSAPGQIIVMKVEGTHVVLRNTTKALVPFGLLVVPATMVGLLMVPWNDVRKDAIGLAKRWWTNVQAKRILKKASRP